MHKRHNIAIRVLCQLLFVLFTSYIFAQEKDSSITFHSSGVQQSEKKQDKHLQGILSVGIGPYSGFNKGEYRTFLQPSIGFDFAAKPADFVEMLIGVHLGLSDPLTTSILLGVRQPFFTNVDDNFKLFGDIQMVFFDEAERLNPIGIGIRGAIGGQIKSFTDLEFRVASEYRGRGSVITDGTDTRALWWVGVEVGIAITLSAKPISFTHKDSLRAALLWIASAQEIAELDAALSTEELDNIYDKFWIRRDLTPMTAFNESRMEYERRIALANKRYSRPSKLGIATDMGRALALYGEPSEIEDETSRYDASYQYVLWIYRGTIFSGAPGLFLFETYTGLDSRQIYSNVSGELSGTLPRNLPTKMAKWF